MGNENKVKDLVLTSKKIFLREDVTTVGQAGQVYDLQAEFKKSAKVKKPVFHWTWIGFSIVLVALAIGVS
ncbi:MAG: hypothetical protein JNM63_13360, partial [Spirochaetia bacterium]|nr:hypothetical protein [Spirochaetia bacterium]